MPTRIHHLKFLCNRSVFWPHTTINLIFFCREDFHSNSFYILFKWVLILIGYIFQRQTDVTNSEPMNPTLTWLDSYRKNVTLHQELINDNASSISVSHYFCFWIVFVYLLHANTLIIFHCYIYFNIYKRLISWQWWWKPSSENNWSWLSGIGT